MPTINLGRVIGPTGPPPSEEEVKAAVRAVLEEDGIVLDGGTPTTEFPPETP